MKQYSEIMTTYLALRVMPMLDILPDGMWYVPMPGVCRLYFHSETCLCVAVATEKRFFVAKGHRLTEAGSVYPLPSLP